MAYLKFLKILRKRGRAKVTNIPDWIDLEAWNGWIEMRKRIKCPATERIMRMAIRKLEGFRMEGYDPNEVLNEAEFRQWRGLFTTGLEPKRRASDLDLQRTWKPARVNYSAADREYYNSFYKQHPDLMPEGWKQ